MGTPVYMAPEQHEATHDVDHRVDIYSVGIIVHELLTGKRPTLPRTGEPVQLAPISPRIDPVLRRATAFDRGERYGSAGELGKLLLAARLGG